MDEIEISIQGYVDRLRKQRDFTYGIMLSSGMMGATPPTKFEIFPLPYDSELNGSTTSVDWAAEYEKWSGNL